MSAHNGVNGNGHNRVAGVIRPRKPNPEGRSDPAERAVLGAVLRDGSRLGDLVNLVSQEDFGSWRHQAIFGAAVGLWDRGKPVDVVSVADALHALGRVEEVGGYAYLAELLDGEPTGANAVYYAAIVRDYGLRRRLQSEAEIIATDAHDGVNPAEELLGQAEQRILALSTLGGTGQTSPLSEAVIEAFDAIDRRSQGNGTSGLPSGLIDLDKITSGFHPEQLILVAARPAAGKTAFGLTIARNAALHDDRPVFIASLEMSRIELAERLLAMTASVDMHRIRRGILNADEVKRLADAGDVLRKAPVHIDHAPAQSMLRIAANARRLRHKRGLSAVVLDYLQLVQPADRKAPREQQVADVSRRLKELARELKAPVIAMAQLNREADDNRRPRLSQLRESGALEQDADVVLMLWEPGARKDSPGIISPTRIVECVVGKQRNGPTGEVSLVFHKHYTRFDNYAADDLAPPLGAAAHDAETVWE